MLKKSQLPKELKLTNLCLIHIGRMMTRASCAASVSLRKPQKVRAIGNLLGNLSEPALGLH